MRPESEETGPRRQRNNRSQSPSTNPQLNSLLKARHLHPSCISLPSQPHEVNLHFHLLADTEARSESFDKLKVRRLKTMGEDILMLWCMRKEGR